MNDISDEYFMSLALEEAKLAMQEGEVPVGAVIVLNNEVVARTHNNREKELKISGHAEILALEIAAKKLDRWSLEGCTLYVTLEPCLMCGGAIMQSRLKRLVYGAEDPKKGAITSNYYVFDDPKAESRPLIEKGVLQEECSALLQEFFATKR